MQKLLDCLIPSRTDENQNVSKNGYRAVAYVTVPACDNWRWIGTDDENGVISKVDTRYVTHINFAFGMIQAYQFDPKNPGRPLMNGEVASPEAYKDPSDGKYHYKVTLDGWIEEVSSIVEGGKYLKALVDLKKEKPELKVLLSIGGWDSDGFCYMARTPEGRAEFIESCIDLIEKYDIDGIDIDWEFPTNGGWGVIAVCDNCVDDAQKLLVEMREALNNSYPLHPKLLTVAAGSSQFWVKKETLNFLDYVGIMSYDSDPSRSGTCRQAALYEFEPVLLGIAKVLGDTTEARHKLNLGIPFNNGGGAYLVPYYKGYDGVIDASPEITAEKAEWVKKHGFGGVFYWAYSMDIFEQDVETPDDSSVKILQKTVYETLNG